MPNTSFPATAEGMPKFSSPKQVSLFMEMTPLMRQRIEQTVDHLIWLLDTCEEDLDLEDDGTAEDGGDDETNGDDEPLTDDEPSIGVAYYAGYGVIECDLELDNCDHEPSLAAGIEGFKPAFWPTPGQEDFEMVDY